VGDEPQGHAQRGAAQRVQVAQGVTEFVFQRMLAPSRGVPAISLTPGGHLQLLVNESMLVRAAEVLLVEESLEVASACADEERVGMSRVTGVGVMVLGRDSGTFVPLRLRQDACFFVASAIWAVERGLHWEGGVLPGSRAASAAEDTDRGAVSLLRINGNGLIALRVAGECAAFKVSARAPVRVRARGLLGWIGRVVPEALPGGEYIRCEGEGAVLLELPRGRDEGAA
jgi:hypothetical protein